MLLYFKEKGNDGMASFIGIGVDIGGTMIKAARVSQRGEMFMPLRHPTPTRSREGIISLVSDMIEEQISSLDDCSNIAVGIGFPGYCDDSGYIIGGAYNLPDWHDFNLAQEISAKIAYPVYTNNDASLAAFGEYASYYAQSVQNLAYLGLGTGVGGGLVIRGKLYSGVHGFGTEFGHLVVDPSGPICVCGRRGCLETIASRKGLAIQARTLIERHGLLTQFARDVAVASRDFEPEEIFRYAESGDSLAIELLDNMCDAIARACDTLAVLLAPEIIVLGGGIMNAGSLILDNVRKRFEHYCMPDFLPHIHIEPAHCGENSGIIGAGLYALSHLA